jgi:alkylation response protein AidB-like acyl-CoA dehydrogenase
MKEIANMAILEYEKKHDEFRTKLREFFAKEVTPYAAQWEKDHIVPREAWTKIGRAGLLAPMVPEAYGGLGGDFLYAVICAEEYAYTNQGGFFLTLHNDVVVPYIISYGTEEIRREYLPKCVNGDCVTAVAMTEPGAGSDLSSMEATAVEDGDEIVINGTKTFISNALLCDIVIVAAKDPNVENPHEAISLYIVPTDTQGFSVGNRFDKMGMYSQDTAEMFFNNVRIPKNHLLGAKGSGFIILMEKLQQERLCAVTGTTTGLGKIVDDMIEYCKKTKVNGKPLAAQQVVQAKLVEMKMEANLAQTYSDVLVKRHVAGENIVAEISMAKYWYTEKINEFTNSALELFEELGALEECPLARGFRDTKITTIFAGTNEIMKQVAANFLGIG